MIDTESLKLFSHWGFELVGHRSEYICFCLFVCLYEFYSIAAMWKRYTRQAKKKALGQDLLQVYISPCKSIHQEKYIIDKV